MFGTLVNIFFFIKKVFIGFFGVSHAVVSSLNQLCFIREFSFSVIPGNNSRSFLPWVLPLVSPCGSRPDS